MAGLQEHRLLNRIINIRSWHGEMGSGVEYDFDTETMTREASLVICPIYEVTLDILQDCDWHGFVESYLEPNCRIIDAYYRNFASSVAN
jgi:hypothetical protein